MSRKSRDQRGQFKTMVRYDGRGRIIPGGNILKKGKKPQEGRWEAKEAYECCTGALIDRRIILPYAWDHSTPGPDEIWTFDTVGRNDEWAGTLTERQELNGDYIEIGSSLYKLTPDDGSFIVTLANSINSQVISTDATEFQYNLSVGDGVMEVDDVGGLVILERIVL